MQLSITSPRSILGVALGLAVASSAAAQVSSYTFAQSTGTYTPITGATVLGTVTSTSGATSLDDVVYSVPLPFTFTYDGAPQTQVWINTNGWLAFGATSPGTTNYAALASTAVTPGFVAPGSADLQGGYVFTSTRTSGSNQVTAINAIGPVAIGDILVGTGIPTGTTVVAIAGNTLTMSANATATSTGTATTAIGTQYDLSWAVEGASPNQVFVAQWRNFKRFGSTLTTTSGLNLNFQVRLFEATGEIQCVYGNCSPGVSTSTGLFQTGLRGPTNAFPANINCRQNTKGTNDWATSAAGASNAAGQVLNNLAPANVIPNGLTYSWTLPLPCSGTPNPGATIASVAGACPGANFTLSLQNATTGTGVAYQWYSSTAGAGGPWTPVGTGLATLSTSQLVTTWYYCDVTCSAGPSTGSSTVLQVNMAATTFPQDFASGVITPNCWSTSALVGASLPDYNAASAFASGTGSARWNFYSISNTNQPVLTSPPFTAVAGGTQVYFDVAGCTYTGGEVDSIVLEESNDSGTNWTPVVTMTNAPGGLLNTIGGAGTSGSNFVPTASQWASLAYSLSAGTDRIRFRGISNFGNSCFLDNISVGVMPSARHTVYGNSCATPASTLSSATPPIIGSTILYDLGNIPLACPSPDPVFYFGIIAISLGQDFAGTDLLTGYGVDAPGCKLHLTSLDVVLGYVDTVPTQQVPFTIPGFTVPGFLFYSQAAALICPAAPNNAGILLSNGLRSYCNTF